MKVLDLFSGIGGFSLAAHWLGWQTIAFCEVDPFCQKVIAKNFPGVPIFGDIKTLKGDNFNGSVDIICGGFPCQPFSTAGKRRGKDDDRHLWPEMFRIIREVRPRWVVGENVAGIIRMGLDDVLADLESEGYTLRTFIIPACGIGAQHRRDRVWIVGYSEHNGLASCDFAGSRETRNGRFQTRQNQVQQFEGSGLSPIITDTKSIGHGSGRLSKREKAAQPQIRCTFKINPNAQSIGSQSDTEHDCCKSCSGQESIAKHAGVHGNQFSTNTDGAGHEKQQFSSRIGDMEQNGVWQMLPDPQATRSRREVKPGVRGSFNGVSERLDRVIESCWSVPAWVEKDQTGPGYKNRIKALGNSIVPQVVYQIFKAIQEIEDQF